MKTVSCLILVLISLVFDNLLMASTVIYSKNFETGVGSEWSASTIDTTPTGRKFLGRFTNDKHVQFNLGAGTPVFSSGLPSHTSITVSFDLYIIHSWDGGLNGDFWGLRLAGGNQLIYTSFANPLNGTAINPQHYPGNYPVPTYPAQTGAVEINTLGYWNVYPTKFGDSVYNMTFTFPHAESNISFEFYANGVTDTPLPYGLQDESWGLDNITVSVIPEPATLLLLGLGGVILRKRKQ